MLKLNDCELANLRLECLKHAENRARWKLEVAKREVSIEEIYRSAERMYTWCLRDRDEPVAGEG